MKIGIDVSRANKKHRTGTEWYAYYLVRELALLDKDNEYILYTDKALWGGLARLGKDYDTHDKEIAPEFDAKGFQKLESPHGNFKAKILRWPFRYFWTLGGLSLEMFLRKPDILFIPSHVLPFFHPRRSVVTIHDIGFIRDDSLFAKDVIGPEALRIRSFINLFVKILTFGRYGANSFDYLRWSTSYALRKAKRIISVSHFTKKELLDYYKADAEKIKVVHNGYPRELYKRCEDKEKLALVLEQCGIEQPYFFYIGRLEKKKNIAALIEAYAIFRDKYKDQRHKLLLVGDASYGFDEIKYMTREFDIVDDVIMPGWLEEEIIPYIYSGAAGFIFPSKYEGFGIPLLQAMACGTPIAASRVSSIPEVAGDAAVYFHPDFALSIADAMQRLVSEPENVVAMVAKGYKRVENFSWEKCTKETLEIIKGMD
jgi:glycosyltransferase involved in cell wall biosynthesis